MRLLPRRTALHAFLAALVFAGSALSTQPVKAQALPDPIAEDSPDWRAILDEADGQTVFFNHWGGDDQINDYIAWVADHVRERYGVDLRSVKVTDIAETVGRLLAEKQAGRTDGGTVDLMWINGENFAAMKRNDLLGAPFTHLLPNFAHVDTTGKPTTLVDFTVPTDGLESPWGMAQIVFIYDTTYVPEPPRTLPALLAAAEAGAVRFTYPLPPDFLGSTFLKQVLVSLTEDRSVLERPVSEAAFDAVTAPVWTYLDALHPHLWRSGRTFPPNMPALIRLLGDGEIDLAFNFNPAAASAAIADGRLPQSVRTYVLEGGTIGNTHFVAIPYNANARAGAIIAANFLLSPEAQLRKEDPDVWGDPTVLAVDALPAPWPQRFADLDRGPATLSAAELGTPIPEPHPTWMEALEAEWQRRYGQ